VENPTHSGALQLRRKIQELEPAESLDGARLTIKGGKPVSLQFRDASLRQVMEAIARTTGVNVMFEKDVKTDTKVTIFLRDTPVDEAIDLILMQTQNARRVLSENSILIYPDTENKAKDYADLKIRRFALTNADPKQVQSMIKTLLKTKDLFVDEKTNAVVVRDTPQVIRMVEKLIASMDQPEPEVMLEVDVMEVSRDRLTALGIDLPTSFGASTSGMTLQQFRNLTDADVTVTALSAGIVAKKTDSDINDLATPRIRVRNKEKAKFLVGDRLPVISTAAVPSTTTSSAVYNTNVQYVEVGIKIEVEPTIYDDGEVAIRMNLEVSSNSGQNTDAAKTGTIAYTISTRSVNTVLRLKDGQTEIFGGLIQDQDRNAGTKIPGLGDMPVLGRLFGSQTDTKNKTEIILSITPRIVRSNRQADNSVLEMWSGTETNFRAGVRPPTSGSVGALAADTANLNAVAAASPAAAVATAATAAAGTPAAAPAKAAKPMTLLKPFVLNAAPAVKVGSRFDVQLAQPVYSATGSAELALRYDPEHLRLVSAAEADPERNTASGARFSADVDTAGWVRFSLTAASGQVLPEASGGFAQLQFEAIGEPGPTRLQLVDVTLKSTVGEVQPVAPTPDQLLEVQAEK